MFSLKIRLCLKKTKIVNPFNEKMLNRPKTWKIHFLKSNHRLIIDVIRFKCVADNNRLASDLFSTINRFQLGIRIKTMITITESLSSHLTVKNASKAQWWVSIFFNVIEIFRKQILFHVSCCATIERNDSFSSLSSYTDKKRKSLLLMINLRNVENNQRYKKYHRLSFTRNDRIFYLQSKQRFFFISNQISEQDVKYDHGLTMNHEVHVV